MYIRGLVAAGPARKIQSAEAAVARQQARGLWAGKGLRLEHDLAPREVAPGSSWAAAGVR